MPPRPPRLKLPRHVVTAVVVAHDGAAWLPECLAGLTAQVRPPQRVVAVDVASTDDSARLLAESLGTSAVVSVPRDTGLGAAVNRALEAFDSSPGDGPGARTTPVEWVWLLHDDCAADPTALLELLARAEQSPTAAVLGPKCLSWDRRLLVEVGVTTDGSGRRETGLEAREVDQGQHDDVSDVLAVGTAGMLVRRDVWDALGGLDPAWPLFGDDVDFGWRANAAGHRVLLAPRAVVRHAAALSSARRPADAVRGPARTAARLHGLQVALANTAASVVPVLVLRFVVASLLRSLLALIGRDPSAARAELLTVPRLAGSIGLVAAARRRRRDPLRSHRDLRPLLAPPGLRWRRWGDALAGAVAGRGAVDTRRRRRAPLETGPVAEEAEFLDLGSGGGLLLSLLRRPVVVLAVVLAVVALVADRHLLGGTLHGGRLLPAPAGSRDLWATYTASWHPDGLGSTAVAPPALAVVAAMATVMFGKAWLAVDVLMLGAVPLAGVAAYAGAGAVTRRPAARLVAAVLWAVLPAVTGAVAGGRLDVVIAAIVLPLAARAVAAALGADPRADGGRRCARAGVALAVVTAVTPLVWLVALPLLLVAAPLAPRAAGPARRVRAAAAAGILALPPLLLLPWTWHAVVQPRLLVTGSGLPELLDHAGASTTGLLLLQPGGPAQPPLWVFAPVLLIAVLALGRARRSAAAAVGFAALLFGLAAAVAVSHLAGSSAGAGAGRPWSGAALLVAALGALTAATAGADAVPAALARHSFGWRQAGVLALAGLVAAAALTTLGAWVARGSDGPLTDRDPRLLPIFAAAEVALPSAPRVLALRAEGSRTAYTLLRRSTGPVLGDADVAGGELTPPQRRARQRLAAAVRDAISGQSAAVPELAEFGVSLIVVPNPAAPVLSRLGAAPGLDRVPANGSTVFRAEQPAGQLVVLGGADATRAGHGQPLALTARPTVLASRSMSTGVAVAGGPAGRLLVLAAPASSAWHARLDGRTLTATTAYGWAQAWQLPAGGGTLLVQRDAGSRHWLLTVQLVLVLLAAVASLPGRRPEEATT